MENNDQTVTPVFPVDELPERQPTDYFITSVGFCENVIFARNASLAKLSIDSLETTVTGSWDRRSLFEIEGVSSNFKSITVET